MCIFFQFMSVQCLCGCLSQVTLSDAVTRSKSSEIETIQKGGNKASRVTFLPFRLYLGCLLCNVVSGWVVCYNNLSEFWQSLTLDDTHGLAVHMPASLMLNVWGHGWVVYSQSIQNVIVFLCLYQVSGTLTADFFSMGLNTHWNSEH